MADRASMSRSYHVRLLIMGVACVLLSLWFLYDGFTKYPQMQATHQRYVQMKEQYPTEWQQRWAEVVAAEGVPDVPQPKSDWDIRTQKIFGFLLLPVGVIVLVRLALNLRRWVEMDERGLRDHTGRDVPWADLREIDKTRWDRKGIAVVRYHQAGRDGRIVLDDWKYDRAATTRIVERIDEHLGLAGPDVSAPEPAQEDAIR